MFNSILEDIKREFSYGNMVTRLIIVNVAVFIIFRLVWVFIKISHQWDPSGDALFNDFIHLFEISSDWWYNLTHPWVLFTHMFLHFGVFHILWNMLFLYWFGRIVGDLIGNQYILPIYLLGGLVGALFFFISAQVIPNESEIIFALGASGAVMAIVAAAGTINPDHIMHLFLIGEVKIKYIVMVLIFLDVIGIGDNLNTGGHFAHLGGAALGWLFVRRLRDGSDWAIPVNRFFDNMTEYFHSLFKPKKKGPRVAYKNPERPARKKRSKRGVDATDLSHQERLDQILDKIKKSGYRSLSEEEKEFLFNASKQ